MTPSEIVVSGEVVRNMLPEVMHRASRLVANAATMVPSALSRSRAKEVALSLKNCEARLRKTRKQIEKEYGL